MISRTQSAAMRSILLHYVPIIMPIFLTILTNQASLVRADCCYMMTYEKVQNLDYTINITSTSNRLTNFTRQNAVITFPRDYITNRQLPVGPNSLQCIQDMTDALQLNRWVCGVSNTLLLQARFASAMPNSNPPTVQITMYNEVCKQESSCPDYSAFGSGGGGAGGGTKSSDDPNKGKIFLGTLGYAKPEVFYPILVLSIVAVFGLAFFAFYRTRKSKRDPLDGFGRSGNVKQKQAPADLENQVAANEIHDADNSGYASFAAARKLAKSSNKNSESASDNQTNQSEERRSSRNHSGREGRRKRQSTLLQDITPPSDLQTDDVAAITAPQPAATSSSSLGRERSKRRVASEQQSPRFSAKADSRLRESDPGDKRQSHHESNRRSKNQSSSSRRQHRYNKKPLISLDDE